MSCAGWNAAMPQAPGRPCDDRTPAAILAAVPLQRRPAHHRPGHDPVAAERLDLLRLPGVDPTVHRPGLAQAPHPLAGGVLHLPVPWHAAVYPTADLLHRDLQPGSGPRTATAELVLP